MTISVADGSLAGLSGGAGSVYSQLTSGVGPKRVAVCFGDSTSRSSIQYTPTALSASGTTVSATLSSHQTLPGSYIFVERTNDHEYRGMYQISATPDADTIQYVVPVAPSVSPATGTLELVKVAFRTNHPVVLASATAGGLFSDIWSVNVGGETAAGLMRRIPMVLAHKPDFVNIMCGINDIALDVSADELFIRLMSLYDRIAASGAITVLQTPGPMDSRWAFHSAARMHVVNALNARLRRVAQDRRNFRLFDTNAIWTDPTDSAGAWRADYSSDGVHPGDVARTAAASAMYTILSREFPLIPPWPCVSVYDDYGDSSSSENLLEYGLFQGSGGTKGGTPATSGDVATGWTVNTSGGGNCAASVDARSDGFGNDQTIVITAADSGDGFIMPLTTSIHSRLVAGSWIEMGCHVQLSSLDVDTASFTVALVFTIGGVARWAYAMTTTTIPSGSTGSWWFRTARVRVPNLTITSCVPRIACTLAGAGNGTIKVGRMYVRQWSA